MFCDICSTFFFECVDFNFSLHFFCNVIRFHRGFLRALFAKCVIFLCLLTLQTNEWTVTKCGGTFEWSLWLFSFSTLVMNVLTSCEMHYFLLASFFADENFNILLLLAILVVCVLDVSICCLFLFVCWCAWLAERKRRCQMEKLKKGFGKNSLFGGSDCLYSIFIELFHCVFDPVANFCSVFFSSL